jgi:hypothetical protein
VINADADTIKLAPKKLAHSIVGTRMGRWFASQLMVTPRTTYGVIEDSLWVEKVNL